MSTLVAVALYANSKRVTCVYSNLLEAFGRFGTLYHGRSYRKVTAPEYDHKMDIKDVFNVINTVRESADCLDVRAAYSLKSGRSIGVNLMLPGRDYERGFELADNGPICIGVRLNDLARPPRELGSENGKLTQSNEYGVVFVEDSQDLFHNLCRWASSAACPLIHGCMYLEYGWPSASQSAMLYHADPLEVARDMARIYYEFRFGVRTPTLLGEDVDVWDYQIPASAKKQAKPDVQFYRQFDRPNGEGITSFLSGLQWERVKRFARVSREEIIQRLKEANRLPLGVRCEVMEDQSVFLYSDPLSSVWRFYEWLYTTMP